MEAELRIPYLCVFIIYEKTQKFILGRRGCLYLIFYLVEGASKKYDTVSNIKIQSITIIITVYN
jgi:hypothetical protein